MFPFENKLQNSVLDFGSLITKMSILLTKRTLPILHKQTGISIIWKTFLIIKVILSTLSDYIQVRPSSRGCRLVRRKSYFRLFYIRIIIQWIGKRTWRWIAKVISFCIISTSIFRKFKFITIL